MVYVLFRYLHAYTTAPHVKLAGTKWLGTLTAVSFFGHQIGAAFASWGGGWEYDATHTYSIMLWFAFGASVFAGVCITFASDKSLRHKNSALVPSSKKQSPSGSY